MENRASTRSSEQAEVGYFTMALEKHDVKAELSASHSVGFINTRSMEKIRHIF